VALLDADADARLRLPADVFDADDSGELTLQLRHNHLPKLDRVGVISWDREAMRVGRGPEFDGIEPLLEPLDDNPRRPPREVAVAVRERTTTGGTRRRLRTFA
jgi:hypothetical protein